VRFKPDLIAPGQVLSSQSSVKSVILEYHTPFFVLKIKHLDLEATDSLALMPRFEAANYIGAFGWKYRNIWRNS
jgi:hypothetical protein